VKNLDILKCMLYVNMHFLRTILFFIGGHNSVLLQRIMMDEYFDDEVCNRGLIIYVEYITGAFSTDLSSKRCPHQVWL
jgi:hypothetical protein